jgi:hypothetical protein
MGRPELTETLLLDSQRKTGIYNMLEQKGQSDESGGGFEAEKQRFLSG